MSASIGTDFNVLVFPTANYLFLGVSGAVTVSGFWIDNTGAQTGASFTASVNIANGSNSAVSFSTIAGATPASAVAAVIIISGDLYWSLGNSGQATDFKNNYVNYPKMLAGDGYIPLSKIF